MLANRLRKRCRAEALHIHVVDRDRCHRSHGPN